MDKILKTIGVPEPLLMWLENNFPDTLPKDPEISLDELRYLQGQQSVIAALRQLNDEENE